ncbi:MAG: MBL fold metallo-hydrolase [Clostridiales bacterium]|nr:MBL fold metallo-hydrolase [Clostridiales bacterium]
MAKLTKKEKQTLNNTAKKYWKIVVAVVLIAIIAVVVAYYLGWLNQLLQKDQKEIYEAGEMTTHVETLEDLKINFLDVGQGDCIIIQFPDNKNMIIDSGDDSYTDERSGTITPRDTIKAFTDENKIDTFDYVLLTHSDSDHSANMSWVINNYKVKYIFRPATFCNDVLVKDIPMEFNNLVLGSAIATNDNYANFMISAYNSKAPTEIFNKDSDFKNYIVSPEKSTAYSFDFLTPVADRDKISYSDVNNNSPLLMLEYANRKVLFTGDAEKAVIKEYLDVYGDDNNIDVLKVGHHGSKTSTTEEFLKALDPEVAIIQCGEDNTHGHPDIETLNYLYGYEDGGINVFRNDTNGHITLSIASDGAMSFEMDNEDVSKNNIDGEGKVVAGGGVEEASQVAIYDYVAMSYYRKEMVA